MAKIPPHLAGMFDDRDADEDDCPPLTVTMVSRAEKQLGYRLPLAYVELLNVRNGGDIRRSFYPTTKCPRWADDHVSFDTVMGIGGDWGIDSETGSAYLIAEWAYPAVGVVISSDGHTAFMLDYRECGPQGEPRVAWVDVETGTPEPEIVVIAPDFMTFLKQLRVPPEDAFE
jgi:hypothetical protein